MKSVVNVVNIIQKVSENQKIVIDLRFQKLDYLTNEISPENPYDLVLENPKFKLSSKNFTGSKSGIYL